MVSIPRSGGDRCRFFPPVPSSRDSLTWNRRKTRIKPRVDGDSFYGHEGRAASKEIRKLMHIQGRGDRFNGINSRSKNWYNLARRVLGEPSCPLWPPLAASCARWFVGNRCQEGLTWAFLRQSLYLRERARNINPGPAHQPRPNWPPVPSEIRLNSVL